MWARPPHKRALDYMWYMGQLATSRRENFTKFYDLPQRVIPQDYLKETHIEDKLSWLCQEAMKRLTLATPAQLQDFWGAASALQIKDWLTSNDNNVHPVEIQTVNGEYIAAYAISDIENYLKDTTAPTSRA